MRGDIGVLSVGSIRISLGAAAAAAGGSDGPGIHVRSEKAHLRKVYGYARVLSLSSNDGRSGARNKSNGSGASGGSRRASTRRDIEHGGLSEDGVGSTGVRDEVDLEVIADWETVGRNGDNV